jgi:glycosyltransferase involved in cell wall biosynthesis
MRICWASIAPWIKSGYGTQTAQATLALQAMGHDVMIYAYRGLMGDAVEWHGIPVMPRGKLTEYGLELLPYYCDQHQADLCITLTDLIAFTHLRTVTRGRSDQMKFAHWAPISAAPIGDPDASVLRQTGGTPIAMSRFAERALKAAGFDPAYVPHAIDTAVWRPLPPEIRARARAELGFAPTTFVIGTDAANEDPTDRKGWGQTLCAFAAFHARHPDSVLYAHTIRNRHPFGLDLAAITETLGITSAVRYPDPDLYNAGAIPTAALATITATWDLYTGCSHGEGFGIPIVQAQACGVPAVAANATATAELAPTGWKAATQPHWSGTHGAWWAMPLIDAIEAAYEDAWGLWDVARTPGHRSAHLWPDTQQAARESALAYDTTTVAAAHWAPALKQLEST